MAFVSKIEIKQTAKGSDYKSVRLDEMVLGKDRFNIFKFHSRYDDVTEGKEFKVADFQFSPDQKYLELIDPDKGTKKGYTNNPAPSNDKLDLILAEVREIKKLIANQPPF